MKNSKNTEKFPIEVKSVFPKKRDEVLNVNGWGFKDSYFTSQNGALIFTGNRYPLCNIPLKKARQNLQAILDADIKDFQPISNPVHRECDYPPAVENQEFIDELKWSKIEFSIDFNDRFHRCHGQAMKDFYILRYGKFDRVPDVVIFPKSHEDVVACVKLANKYYSVIIPYAGGTNTMLTLNHSKDDRRFFISLDMTQMNRILWIDKKSMLACMEAGIVGLDMEEALEKEGLTVGHEPDSIELSTLGGWVATRSSGMKQQTYGNIEDIVNKITLVTSVGVLEKDFIAPRVSIGPDFHQIVLGSEGTLGVITKVVVKVHKRPQVRRFGSLIFPDFEHGTRFMYEVSKFPIKPSSLRLVDNYHIQIGLTFENHKTLCDDLINKWKVFALSHFYRYDINKISLVTYLIENDKEEADKIEEKLKQAGHMHSGIMSGPEFGKRTHLMTLVVCYTRDLFFDLGYLFDSLETSVTWDKLWPLITSLRNSWQHEMNVRKLKNGFALRISQIYHTGACVYLYFGIGPTAHQFDTFSELSKIIKGVMIKAGATLSHHHGVGKKNIEFYPKVISKVGVDIFKAIKAQIDPNNVFAAGNIINCKL